MEQPVAMTLAEIANGGAVGCAALIGRRAALAWIGDGQERVTAGVLESILLTTEDEVRTLTLTLGGVRVKSIPVTADAVLHVIAESASRGRPVQSKANE